MEFPTAMLGVALGTILLPSLAKANTEADHDEYSSLLDWGLRLTFLLAVPAAVGMAALAEPLISVLFHYGKFDNTAAVESAKPLIAYSAGLLGIILVKTLAPAFYAKQDIRTPVKIAVGVLFATQLMNLLFVFVAHLEVAGLALSIGLGACINAGFLYAGLRSRGIYAPQPGWPMFYLKLAIAAGLMGAAAWFGAQQVPWLAMRGHALLRAGALLGLIAGCAVLYFAILFALGFRIRDFKRREK
jgi:putative peptidoglycan lipid II flippase